MKLKAFFENYPQLPSSSGAAATFNLSNNEFAAYFWGDAKENTLFDLASLSKPINIAFAYLDSPFEMDSLLGQLANHRAGFEPHKVLNKDWKSEILSLKISSTKMEVYSDLSLLRFMLEWEQENVKSLSNIASKYRSQDFMFWKEVDDHNRCLPMGMREGKSIQGSINDDNAYLVNEFVSHTGYFSTAKGLFTVLKTLKKNEYFDKLRSDWQQKQGRFFWGFDTPTSEKTLAGFPHPQKTIGFLGFTGTSFWLDLESEKGCMLLTNRVENDPHNTDSINQLRRSFGHEVWNSLS